MEVSPSMNSWNPDKIIEILIESAKIALLYYDKPKKEIKEDLSLVTIADKAIENKMAEYFDDPDKNSYMIGEETVNQKDKAYLNKALNHTAWIVDPIDGTVPYANGLSYWGISVGYAEKGIIREGAIYFPLTKDMFITNGTKVFLGKVDPDSGETHLLKTFNELTKPDMSVNKYDIVVLTQTFAKHGKINISNPVLVLCCATASFCFTASGKFMSYSGSNIKLWDYAASLAVLKKLGFKMTFLDNTEMSEKISSNHDTDTNSSINFAIRGKVTIGATQEIVRYITDNIDL